MQLPSLSTTIGGVKAVDKLMFTKHLAVMLKSGIPLAEALDVLEGQGENRELKKVIAGLGKSVRNGQRLEKAMEHFPKVFDPLFLRIVGAGEESGNLEVNLEYMAKELGKAYEFKKKVQAAMLYPSFILATALLVGGGISIFILPKLVDLFESLDVQLPLSTKILLFFARVMQQWGIFIGIGAVVAIVGFGYLIRTRQIKPWWHRAILNMPLWGKVQRDTQLASFCRNLGLMLKSGLHITTALKVCALAATNMVFSDYIRNLEAGVQKGQSLEALLTSGRYPYILPIVQKMIGVGERTGKLDETLLYLGDFFEEEVDEVTKNFSSILEPVLLVIIALGVAYLAMAIITPIYELTSGIKR